MRLFPRKVSKKAGLSPGTLIHIGERKSEETQIQIIFYDEHTLEEKELKTIEEAFSYGVTSGVTWINIDGLHDIELMEKLGKHFDFHPLILEDVVNTGQRPKIEDFEKCVFIVLKMLYADGDGDKIIAEQVSIILGPNYVISFQEKEGDVFDAIRERIRNAKGRVRKMGADYLAYSLLDAIIDNYFLILERIGEKIESMEEDLVKNPTPNTLQTIHGLKGDMIFLRKAVWPLREVINILDRREITLISENTSIYLRDLYDHTIQVIDNVETFREMVSGMLDIYLSSVSNRMNEVMKVLTIFAAIFIPLTFVAGIYGMNFNPQRSPFNMPELNWYFGYPFALGLMVLVAAAMVIFFKRKKWF